MFNLLQQKLSIKSLDEKSLLYAAGSLIGLLVIILLLQVRTVLNTAMMFTQSTSVEPTQAVTSAATTKNNQQASITQLHKLTTLASLELFGAAAIATAVSVEQTPKTALALTLSGVMVDNEPTASYAIITFPDGKEESYRVGEEIPDAGKIKEVSAEGIVFFNNGQLESLAFKEEDNTSTSMMTASAPTPATPHTPAQLQQALKNKYAMQMQMQGKRTH